MQTIKIIAADPFFFEEHHVPEHELSREVSLARSGKIDFSPTSMYTSPLSSAGAVPLRQL